MTYNALEDWKDNFKSDPKLKALSTELISIHDDVFKKQKISHFDFEKELEDAGLTKELNIMVYRKIWASLRHDLYLEIQSVKNETHKLEISQEQFDELWEEVFMRFDSVRTDVYNMMMDDRLNEKESKIIMLKAYIEF